MRQHFERIRLWLSGFSYRTGLIVLALCVLCYVLSFAQMALPSSLLSVKAKGALWVLFYGLAKTFQYTALAILGKEGWQRVKAFWQRRKHQRASKKAATLVSKDTSER